MLSTVRKDFRPSCSRVAKQAAQAGTAGTGGGNIEAVSPPGVKPRFSHLGGLQRLSLELPEELLAEDELYFLAPRSNAAALLLRPGSDAAATQRKQNPEIAAAKRRGR